MEKKMDEEMLQVRMLGGFSVTYKGIQIAGGPKARESQFAYLMQMLLYHGRKGVSRRELEEVLFGEREVGNVHHSLRSVLYNARKRLQKAGLPDMEYICQEKGQLYWTEKIPAETDVKKFKELCQLAEEAKEPGERLAYLLDACYCYSGDFLPQQSGVIWIAQEARCCRKMFFSCVEEAAEFLRMQEDWQRMKELGVYASRISPFADWETITMEALVSMGWMSEARKLYDETVEAYVREQGFRPSRKLMELLEQLGDCMDHQYAVLDAIQSELTEEERVDSGYLCPWPVFQGIYQMERRILERSGQSVYLMLCTIVDSKGNPMEEGNVLEELSKRLETAVCSSVRHGDAVTRYGKGQYLVLLVNTTREDCSVVQKRINSRFLVGRQRTGIKYYVSSVVCQTNRQKR